MAELHEGMLKAILTLLLGYADPPYAPRCELEALGAAYIVRPSDDPLLPLNRLVANKFEDLRNEAARLLGTGSCTGPIEEHAGEEDTNVKLQCLRFLMKVSVFLAGREPIGDFNPDELINPGVDPESEERSYFLGRKAGSKKSPKEEFIPWETIARFGLRYLLSALGFFNSRGSPTIKASIF